MNKSRVVGVLAALVVLFGAGRPALAQNDGYVTVIPATAAAVVQLDARPLHDYVARMSLQEQPTTERKAGGKMPLKYKVWSGVLFGLGGYYLLSAAIIDPEEQTCLADTCIANSSLRKAWIGIGTGVSAVGAIVLAKGFSRAHEMAPSVSFGRGRVVVTERISLPKNR